MSSQNTPKHFSSRLKIRGKDIDKILEKYDFANMTKGEAIDGLSEKQINFCREYLRIYNVTQAAINAGHKKETAHIFGSKEIRKERCMRYLCWLKYRYERDTYFDSVDMMNKLIAIVNTDITDYAEFGTRLKPVKNMQGQLVTKDGIPIMENQSYMNFKNHDKVDGGLVQEIGWSKSGPYIKFFDKIKAIELLTQFSPMTYQAKMQKEKLKLEREKVSLQKAQFLYAVQKDKNMSEDEKAIKRLKEKMEQRIKLRQLDRDKLDGDNSERISEREKLKKEVNHIL